MPGFIAHENARFYRHCQGSRSEPRWQCRQSIAILSPICRAAEVIRHTIERRLGWCDNGQIPTSALFRAWPTILEPRYRTSGVGVPISIPLAPREGLLTQPTDGVSRRPRHASMMIARPLSLTIAD